MKKEDERVQQYLETKPKCDDALPTVHDLNKWNKCPWIEDT